MEIQIRSPFPFAALPRIWHWMQPFLEMVIDDFGPQTLAEFVERMAAMSTRQKTWAVYGDGELGGLISYEELTPWIGTSHFLLKSEFQRQGISVRAARQVADEIFSHERIGKLVFHPLAGNLAIGSLLINIGAQREGTLEHHTLQHGKPVDIWLYGLTREKFNACKRSSSRDRGNIEHTGLVSLREAKAADHHNDANVLTADAADHGPPGRVLHVVDAEPGGVVRADSRGGPGPHQPDL